MSSAKKLKPVEQLRLHNLLSLHGRPKQFGAPTSKFLAEYLNTRGVSLTTADLTAIYQGAKALDGPLTEKIEAALQVPRGWMSVTHEFVYQLGPVETAAHERLAALPQNIRDRLYSLIEAISNVK